MLLSAELELQSLAIARDMVGSHPNKLGNWTEGNMRLLERTVRDLTRAQYREELQNASTDESSKLRIQQNLKGLSHIRRSLLVEALDTLPLLQETSDAAYTTMDPQYVVVLTGPGTPLQSTKDNEPLWTSWMDRKRIETARNIASRSFRNDDRKILYPGTGLQNDDMRLALERGMFGPTDHWIVHDGAQHGPSRAANTGTQYGTVEQFLQSSTIQKDRVVAVVTHLFDKVRNLFYYSKHPGIPAENVLEITTPSCPVIDYRTGIELVSVQEVKAHHLVSDFSRILRYMQAGYLSKKIPRIRNFQRRRRR